MPARYDNRCVRVTPKLACAPINEPLRALEDAYRAMKIQPSRFRTFGFGKSVRLG
jgi:hypothetical protein